MGGLIDLKFHSPIPWGVRRAIRRAASALPEHSPCKHHLQIIVYPLDEVINIETGDLGLGWFSRIGPNSRGPAIYIGGRPSSPDPEDSVLDTMCHEWAHYEQYRDRREITERGIGKRIRTLRGFLRNA